MSSSLNKVGFWNYNLKTNTIFWSSRVYEIHGVSKESYTPDIESGINFYHPDYRDLVKEKLDLAIQNKDGFEFEFKLVRKDGLLRIVRSIGECILDSKGEVAEISGIFDDITDRIDKTETFDDKESSFSLMIDSSYDGYWDWFIQEDYEYMSPRFWEILGYKAHEKEHKPSEWQELIFPEDLDIALENFDKHVKTKGKHPFHQTVRYKHKNRSTVHVVCKGKVIKWDGDEPIRMIGTHTDVTEINDLQTELNNKNDFLNLLLKNNPDLIFVKDKDFKIIEANDAFINLYPKNKRKKIIGYTTIEEYNKEEADEFLKMDRLAFKNGYSKINESVHFPNGEERVLYTQKIRFYDHKSEPFILGIAKDVTERENLIKKLEESNEQLERFAHVASHDLQEPIRMVSSFNDLFLMKYGDSIDEKGKEYLEFSSASAKRMQNLIRDILNFSKVDSIKENLEIVNCNDALDLAINNLALQIDEKNAVINKPILPEITANITAIGILFQNIISNSIKYCPKDRQPNINIDFKENSDNWLFSISDNGAGIEKHFLKEIFEHFKRFEKSDVTSGCGIGLSTCKKIANNLDGEIWAESTLGSGTTIHFTISKKLEPHNEIKAI